MDKSGIGQLNALLMGGSGLLTLGFLSIVLAAADAESNFLHLLGYILLLPSLVIMTTIMVINWIKNVRTFITFEEITKQGLDNYFNKINTETFIGRGLEWKTAQLGHFWIELRIKSPVSQRNDNWVSDKNDRESNLNSPFERRISEENRLVDYREEGEMIAKISEKQSEVSVPSSNKHKDDNRSKVSSKERPASKNNFLDESISEENESKQNASENRAEPEAFELVEDEKELENYINMSESPEN